jgi:NTE family protein
MQPWRRARRVGRRTEFGMLHVLASCALPFLFPPVQIDDEHFGDGSMHQLAPISAALHLGARRVLVIGVGSPGRRDLDAGVSSWPSLAQIAGHMLDTIFIDTLDTDLERLQRVNQTIELIPEELRQQRGFVLHKVESLVIRPTEHLDAIAVAHARELPRTIRLMMRTLGLLDPNGARLLSYLLFERSYCRQLMRLGFADAMALRTRIVDFLDPVRKPGMGERDQIALTQT